jgi:O-antigen/teichoic acid export membrane protein
MIRNALSNYAGQIFALAVWFFLTPFILRKLGPAGFGLWGLITAVSTYASLLDLGISGAIIKHIAEHEARGEQEEERSIVASALALFLATGTAVAGVGVLGAVVVPRLVGDFTAAHTPVGPLILLAAINIAVSLPGTVPNAVLQGLQRFDLVNLIGIGSVLGAAAATVLVLLQGGGVLGLVVANIVLALVTQGVSMLVVHRVAPHLHVDLRGANLRVLRRTLSFGSSIFLVQAAGRLQTRTDEVVIGALLSVPAITPFVIARRLSELAQVLTNQFMRLLLPLASELEAQQDRARLRLLFMTSTRLTLAISLPVGAATIILAPQILAAWVGPRYAHDAHLVVILTIASLIDTSMWPAGFVLQGMDRFRPVALMAVASGLANLALSIALARPLGVTGVALGTLIPSGVEAAAFVFPYAARVITVSPREGLKEIMLPAAIPAIPTIVVLWTVRQAVPLTSLLTVGLAAACGFLVYALGYATVSAPDSERRTYRLMLATTLRFARAHLRQS